MKMINCFRLPYYSKATDGSKPLFLIDLCLTLCDNY